tara:strand:- start:246 stop:974 length:729 start_codon:yes stop_codon:yes gene_type:complete
MKKIIFDNLKTLIYALIIALIIRSLFFQPFYIPSSSMEPNLLIGDRIFVSKYAYGYSKHSLPFSPAIFDSRIFSKTPERGDVIVFKTPADNRTDYIKRLIGIPGDKIQIIDANLYINEKKVEKKILYKNSKVYCGDNLMNVDFYEETLPDGKKYEVVYRKNGTMINTDLFTVPENHYFFMGDNRDCSKDSRYLSSVGYVKFDNLVGKANIIFFSNNAKIGSIFKIWKWHESIRFNRTFNKIK